MGHNRIKDLEERVSKLENTIGMLNKDIPNSIEEFNNARKEILDKLKDLVE